MGLFTPIKKLCRKLFKDKRIAYLELDGVIAEQKSVAGTSEVLKLLEEVEKQDIKALVVRINSPGGTVGASQEIYGELCRLREKGIKVVASLGDVAASGGVYVAMGADKIVSHGGTVTGSIGVIIKSPNLKKLLEKVGVESDVVKSGKFKDFMSMERGLTDEEREFLSTTINDTYEQFVGVVAKNRGMDVDAVKQYADGRVFTGQQAKEYGFVDTIGGKRVALDMARELAGFGLEGRPDVVVLEKKKPLLKQILHGDAKLNLAEQVNQFLKQDTLTGIPLWLMPIG